MKRFLPFLLFFAIASCEPIHLEPDVSEATPTPSDTLVNHQGEYLLVSNDTADFYLSPIEIRNVTLSAHPSPQALIKNPRYRMPTKLECVCVLKAEDIPTGYWSSRQRILCYDDPKDAAVSSASGTFGTGGYYTFVPHSSVTPAGYQTNYCILPIRSVRKEKLSAGIHITINDEWD